MCDWVRWQCSKYRTVINKWIALIRWYIYQTQSGLLHDHNESTKGLFFPFNLILFTTFSALTSRFALPSEKSTQTDAVLFAMTEDKGMIELFSASFQPICLFLCRSWEFHKRTIDTWAGSAQIKNIAVSWFIYMTFPWAPRTSLCCRV